MVPVALLVISKESVVDVEYGLVEVLVISQTPPPVQLATEFNGSGSLGQFQVAPDSVQSWVRR